MFVSRDGYACSDFKGFTLLMPAVSVGNVGQLAIDLVISTLCMPRVGYFYTDCLVPMVGNNPYATTEEDATELCINAEVYAKTSKELVVLQIRSPFIKNKYRLFCQILLSWVKNSGFSKIVFLSSSHAYQRNDQQLHGTSFRYLISPAVDKTMEDILERLSGSELEQISAFPGTNDDKIFYIPGGGITKLLFTESCSKGIPLVVLLKFCSEGDNIPDAFALADYLNETLPLIAPQIWKGNISTILESCCQPHSTQCKIHSAYVSSVAPSVLC
ncbi:PREDICTED: proteasome assembly chaperone 2 isoform X2 [Thamnophis sirtalis]|uniref:Proteasome assembly chaperone 2 n=1 Tax=Thamnophis sirtalis TaxID=35019 RepID=A0A6I9XUW1_9SAUR|nr:PREDICTED: proteasome assembly chaperone 2 isoform X2 [Thamnophis sirtalis]